MLEIAQMPLARRLWGISKFYQLPFNDTRIQQMNIFDVQFAEFSQLADNPKKLEQYKNRFYDEDFDAWLEEVEAEAGEPPKKENPFDFSEYEVHDSTESPNSALDMPDEECIKEGIGTTEDEQEEYDEFTLIDSADVDTSKITDWEEA